MFVYKGKEEYSACTMNIRVLLNITIDSWGKTWHSKMILMIWKCLVVG